MGQVGDRFVVSPFCTVVTLALPLAVAKFSVVGGSVGIAECAPPVLFVGLPLSFIDITVEPNILAVSLKLAIHKKSYFCTQGNILVERKYNGPQILFSTR